MGMCACGGWGVNWPGASTAGIFRCLEPCLTRAGEGGTTLVPCAWDRLLSSRSLRLSPYPGSWGARAWGTWGWCWLYIYTLIWVKIGRVKHTTDASHPCPSRRYNQLRFSLLTWKGINRVPTMQKIPIKNIIFYFSVISNDFCEQFPEEIIVRSLLEPEFTDVVQVDAKLLYKSLNVNILQWNLLRLAHTWVAFTKLFDRCSLFLLPDLLIFLFVRCCF